MAAIVSVIVVALLAAGLGVAIWAADRNHEYYGAAVPAGVSVIASLFTWIIFAATGLPQNPSWGWLPWVISLAVGAAASAGVAWALGQQRKKVDTEEYTAILQS